MIIRVALCFVLLTTPALAQGVAGKAAVIEASTKRLNAGGEDEPEYFGRPLTYWIDSIRARNAEMPIAFEAMRQLGPRAAAAVPELARLFDEPFSPIRIGADNKDSMLSKLNQIQLRADAIDALAAIGESAAPAAAALVEWALTNRVILANVPEDAARRHFIDLLGVEIIERMRVAGALASFGPKAAPALEVMLTSENVDARKLAVAVMNEQAVGLAALLLKSSDCQSRKLGAAVLTDMWPVFPTAHASALKLLSQCGDKPRPN